MFLAHAAEPVDHSNVAQKQNLEPMWEFGLGFGYIQFEQYPAAGKYSRLFLPFPTFQYRGRTLRADDREGAKAYLWQQGSWSLEMSGTGSAALDSDDNKIREGMKDLPWIIALGPQLIYRIRPYFDFGWGVYQAISTDFEDTRNSGVLLEGKLTYTYEKYFEGKKIKALTKYFLTFKSASQEVQEQYYGIAEKYVTPQRPQYHARAGYLGTELSIFQSFKRGRGAIYFGVNVTDYGMSENKKSPLHQTNGQLSYLFGMTYVLGESSKPAITKENTTGFINQRFQY